MDLNEAKEFLNDCDRVELRDHAFGDLEVSWLKDGKEVAFGYLSGVSQSVCIVLEQFKGEDAKSLVECGKAVTVQRNDETGPDDFVLGYTKPELTTGVLKEITE